MSHTLKQLRAHFHDPLLVKGPTGLAAPLRRGLAELRRAFEGGPTFDPATATRTFTIAAGDYFALNVLPDLLRILGGEVRRVAEGFGRYFPSGCCRLPSKSRHSPCTLSGTTAATRSPPRAGSAQRPSAPSRPRQRDQRKYRRDRRGRAAAAPADVPEPMPLRSHAADRPLVRPRGCCHIARNMMTFHTFRGGTTVARPLVMNHRANKSTRSLCTHSRLLLLPTLAALGAATACSGAADGALASSEEPISTPSDLSDSAYVTSEYPSDTHGSLPYLVTGTAATNQHHSYLKFSVSSLPAGAAHVTASLAVYPESSAAVTINAHCGLSSTWSGSTLTWKNQPGFDAPVAASVSSLTAGKPATFDVSSCVTGNGTFTVVLDQPSGAVVKYESLTASTDRPSLTVGYSATPGGKVIFGMYNDTSIAPAAQGNTASNFRAIADRYFEGSKVNVHRVYNSASNFPATYALSGGGQDPANGNVSFLSVKSPGGDHAGVAAGKYDTEIAKLAASVPHGSYFTMWHEPENDMPANEFVAMFRRFYAVAKQANPDIQIGYVAMAYQWRPGSAPTANEDAWYPGDTLTDFLGVDAYDAPWNGAHSLDTEADFQRWYAWAKGKNKPVVIPEYGVEADATGAGFSDAERAAILEGTIAYLAKEPTIKMVLFWNSTSGEDFNLNPTAAHPADLTPLARAAWNAGITKYGSTTTTY